VYPPPRIAAEQAKKKSATTESSVDAEGSKARSEEESVEKADGSAQQNSCPTTDMCGCFN